MIGGKIPKLIVKSYHGTSLLSLPHLINKLLSYSINYLINILKITKLKLLPYSSFNSYLHFIVFVIIVNFT